MLESPAPAGDIDHAGVVGRTALTPNGMDFVMRSLTTAVAAIICLLFAPPTRADDTLSMPASMNQFVNWYLDHGACGTWVETGVTEAMWTGVPAGVRYTSTINMWYEPATGQLLRSHHWVTDDGRVLSTGSSLMYWDATKGAPVGSGSGYDQGKPYHGTSVLKGMNADTVVWEYTEQSGDTTRTYTVSDRYTGTNTCTNTCTGSGTRCCSDKHKCKLNNRWQYRDYSNVR